MLRARGWGIVVSAGLAAAQLPGQDAPMVVVGDRLVAGAVVRVWLARGDSLEARIEATDSAALFLRVASRGGRGEALAAALKVPVVEGASHDTFTVKVPWTDISKATSRHAVRRYSPWTGYVVGMIGGAALGFGASKVWSSRPADLIVFPLAGGGLGALVGGFVGLVVTRDEWTAVADPRLAASQGRPRAGAFP